VPAGIYWDPSGIPWELKNASEIHRVSDAGVAAGIAAVGPDKGEIPVLVVNNTTEPGMAGTVDWYIAHPAIPTHTGVTSNINASTYGQQIHLVARITPDSGAVPTLGQAAWYDGGTLPGSARLTQVGTASWEPSTWTHGPAFTLTAAVVPVSGTIAGTVTFMSGGASLGTAAVDARTRQARPKAILPVAGKYSISASYSGTGNFLASASQPLTLPVK
jgi:hypothetical protein